MTPVHTLSDAGPSDDAVRAERLLARIRSCPDEARLERLFNEVCRYFQASKRAFWIQEINAREAFLTGQFYREKKYLDQS